MFNQSLSWKNQNQNDEIKTMKSKWTIQLQWITIRIESNHWIQNDREPQIKKPVNNPQLDCSIKVSQEKIKFNK